MRGHVINTISRIWVMIFSLKPECVTEKTKIKNKVKLYKKTAEVQNLLYRNCIWIWKG